MCHHHQRPWTQCLFVSSARLTTWRHSVLSVAFILSVFKSQLHHPSTSSVHLLFGLLLFDPSIIPNTAYISNLSSETMSALQTVFWPFPVPARNRAAPPVWQIWTHRYSICCEAVRCLSQKGIGLKHQNGCNFLTLGQIAEKNNWRPFETILRIVLQFQVDHVFFSQREHASANFDGNMK